MAASKIPILFVRGTHYEVGREVGRQFKDMINDLVTSWSFFNQIILPKYASEEGKLIYERSLRLCQLKFPQYMKELKGISDGSGLPFHKIFLLHIDSLLSPPKESDEMGCTSILNTDPAHPILGHTEDASTEFLKHIYIVDAEIVDQNQHRIEKFCAVAYAGHLPGYTMGYNSSGLIYTINTLYPAEAVPGKTPRNFLNRALLAANNLEGMLTILRDTGTGTSDGFGINLIVYKDEGRSEFYNIEVAPNQNRDELESEINVLKINEVSLYAHCNKYLRISIPEIAAAKNGSSFNRHNTIARIRNKFSGNENCSDALKQIKIILSDNSDSEFPIYRSGKKPDVCATLAVGIFDLRKKSWSIFLEQPDRSSPAMILPLRV